MDCTWDEALHHSSGQLPATLLQVVREGSNSDYLTALARAVLHPCYSYTLLESCSDLFVALLLRLTSHGTFVDVVSALGRVVPLAPHLTDCAAALMSKEILDFTKLSRADDVTRYLLGILRLCRHDYPTFSHFIEPENVFAVLDSPVPAHRYLAIRILQLYLEGADDWFEEMVRRYIGEDSGETKINGPWDEKTIDFRFLTLWEDWRVQRYTQSVRERYKLPSRAESATTRILKDDNFGPGCVRIGQTLFYSSTSPSASNAAQFVFTGTTIQNSNAFGSALKQNRPILLAGPASAGKTSLVRHAAQRTGMLESMITLHINEQSDAKLLLGVYTTGDTPGSMAWKPGVLTTAVQEGRWVLIEDIDRAPNQLLGSLLPLIEKRELFIASRKQTIHTHRRFRLFATTRTSLSQASTTVPLPHMLGRRHWIDVGVGPLSIPEVQLIASARHPTLTALLSQMTASYERLQRLYSLPSFSGRTRAGIIRAIGVADFFKWCARVNYLLRSRDQFTAEDLDHIFLEAVDCFTSSLSDSAARHESLAIIAQELNIDPQRSAFLADQRSIKCEISANKLTVGRSIVGRSGVSKPRDSGTFSANTHVLRNMERIAAAVSQREPVLLVGETGVGKTTAVQYLARQLGKKLVPFNLSQQSESGDLLGGLRPMNTRSLVVSLKDEFDVLFEASFSYSKNQQFIEQLGKYFARGQWKAVCKLWRQALKMVEQKVSAMATARQGEVPSKKRKVDTLDSAQEAAWIAFAAKLTDLERQISSGANGLAFHFVEGNIVKALRAGDWILLDEINLASSDTLEAIADIFDPSQPSILLSEAGMSDRIFAHPDFRVFAAMNPATDVGKKDLPPSIRSRFTEMYVESPDKDLKSLQSIVHAYIRSEATLDTTVSSDVSLAYQQIISLAAQNKLVDGAGQRPHFSLRTLTRVLSYAKYIAPQCNLRRALYEGFQMSFLTFLDTESTRLVMPIIDSHLLRKRTNWSAELKKALREPDGEARHVLAYPGSKHWIKQGPNELLDESQYIITPFIERNLENLVRASSTRQFPILIQGPTSSGKTSMIEYLAKRTGHTFVRINNHEHTDLQEYLGTYTSTSDGSIRFQEGLLVQALRQGYWIVLDELNLAPTDVLEALNRLLDDNRELLVPETQETVRPHPNFMLFATQNPAGLYGGRKTLSRAFRNRFLELHFDDIPIDELQVILHQRTHLPESRCNKIVAVYRELSILRSENRLFEQKSFATLRDLFRWALRTNDTIEQLANNGFMLLAERVRKLEERVAIKTVIEKVMSAKGPRVRLDEDVLYSLDTPELQSLRRSAKQDNVVWTGAMRRLFTLVATALQHNEPILLVGDTGCGKTTVCQMIANAHQLPLHVINAHQNTETSDLMGSQRPVRNRAATEQMLRQAIVESGLLPPEQLARTHPIAELLKLYESALDNLSEKERQAKVESRLHRTILECNARGRALFEWVDGTLVQAMKEGHMFLLDEISLADDSVLERMNSILEPSRSVLLAEKGSVDSFVVARKGFQFLATMNPGGDYGKKELSPALRNRFTEIWVPTMSGRQDMLDIIQHSLAPIAKACGPSMLDFAQWFSSIFRPSVESGVSIREILAWLSFVNRFAEQNLAQAVVHGAALVYIDTLGANPAGLTSMASQDVQSDRARCLAQLGSLFNLPALNLYQSDYAISSSSTELVVGPYRLPRREGMMQEEKMFNFAARATRMNAMRVLRAMQLDKPIMLEGNPGVGKTALISAIAEHAGMPLTRINLSDQTDLIDLFGSDVPVEGSGAGTFEWREASFLRAMKEGQWVLLDEMNLASQSVLEGLNAVLDHRGEVFIPELGQTFAKHADFRLFAAQNPHHQGGGRKGLPASFVNRFTVVYAEPFDADDLHTLGSAAFPNVSSDLLRHAVQLVCSLDLDVCQHKDYGHAGAPWEFNFRDISKWLQLAASKDALVGASNALDVATFLLMQRFRTANDTSRAKKTFASIFGPTMLRSDPVMSLSRTALQVGLSVVPRDSITAPNRDMRGSQEVGVDSNMLQSLMLCVQFSWPVLLCGPTGTGKTRLINQLGCATGNHVVTIALSADSDTMDLIGGFEQSDVYREATALLEGYQHNLEMMAKRMSTDSDLRGFGETLQTWRTIYQQYVNGVNTITDVLASLEHVTLPKIDHLITSLTAVRQSPETSNFIWVDGVLVDALRSGKWIVLDNANLCSASVLDRLNSLLEHNGSLIINEHVEDDGSPRVVVPHANARIFLTADPQYGELSRAMRNRAVELYVGSTEPSSLTCEQLMCESAMQRFRRTAMLEPQTLQAGRHHVLRQAIDHLGIKDYDLLPRFVDQLSHGLYGVCGDGQTQGAALTELLPSLPAHYRQQLSAIYAQAIKMWQLPTDFANVQTIHPLNNQLLLYNSQSLSTRAFRIGSFYDMLNAIKTILNITGRIRSHKQLTAHLTRLESQYLPVSPHKTIGKTGLCLTIAERLSEALSGKLLDQEGQIDALIPARRLIATIQHMLSTIEADRMDPARLVCYFRLVQDFVVRAKISPDPMGMFDANSAANDVCRHLWLQLKPGVPSTELEFKSVQAFQQLCDSFDQMLSKASYPLEEAVNLRVSLRSAFQTAQGTHRSDLQLLSTQLLQTLAEQSGRLETTTPAVAHFRTTFEALWYRFLLLDKSDIAKVQNHFVQRVGLLAGVPTLDGAMPQMSLKGLDTSILPTSRLRDDNNEHHLAKDSVQVADLLHDIDQASSSVTIRNLPLLRFEVETLTSIVLGKSKQLRSNLLEPLDVLLKNVLSAVWPALGLPPLSEDWQNNIAPDSNTIVVNATDENIAERAPMYSWASSIQLVLQYVHQHKKETTSLDASQAWLTLGTVGLQAYLPEGVFDPGLEALIAKESFDACQADLQGDVDAVKYVNQRVLGQAESWRSRHLESLVKSLGLGPPHPGVIRPSDSQAAALHKELEILKRLIRSFEEYSGEESQLPKLSQLMSNLSIVRTRLFADYPFYGDFVGPIIAFLDCLILGHHLAQNAKQHAVNSDTSGIDQLIPFSQGRLSVWRSSQDLIRHNPEDASIADKILWLEVLSVRNNIWKSSEKNLNHQTEQQFQQFHARWRAELDRDQEQHAAKTSLFKYKAADDLDLDAASLEHEIEAVFPSSTPQEASIRSSRINEFAAQIASVHARIYGSQSAQASEVIRLLAQNATEPTRLQRDAIQLTGLPSILSPLQHLAAAISPTAGVRQTYNFYKDRNTFEADKLRRLLFSVVARFQTLHEEWPEHAIPISVIAECNDLLDMPFSSTLPQLFNPLEKLHATMSEWQKIAHSKNSALDLINAVTDTIVNWRRLELSAWSTLFDQQDQQCEQDAASWWFTAYETIIATTTDEPEDFHRHITYLLNTLQIFIEGCGIGEYHARLKLLTTLAAHTTALCRKRSSMSSIASALHTFIAYYSRYQGAISNHFAAERRKLEVSIKEIIQLASWKDRNIDSLRQSATSSHRKLFRILRKYRNLLALPVTGIIATEVAQIASNQLTSLSDLGTITVERFEYSESSVKDVTWQNRPPRYRNIQSTTRLGVQKLSAFEVSLSAVDDIDNFLTSLKSSVKELRDSTPSTKTAENQKLLGHLKSRKRRLLADVLKQLRDMGLQSNMSDDILVRQNSMAAIFSRLGLWEADGSQSSDLQSNHLFFDFLSMMPSVREGSRKHSDDLTNNEANRCVTLLEGVLSMSISQRNELAATHDAHLELQRSTTAISNLTRAGRLVPCNDSRFSQQIIEYETYITVLLAALDLVRQHNALLQREPVHGILVLVDAAQQGQTFIHAVRSSPKLPPGLQSQTIMETMSQLHESIQETTTMLLGIETTYPDLEYITSHVQRWVPKDYDLHQTSALPGPRPSFSNWTSHLLSCLDGVLNSLDKVERSTSTRQDRESWLYAEQESLSDAWNALNIVDINSQLKELLRFLPFMNDSTEELSNASSVLRSVLPILQTYSEVTDRVHHHKSRLHSQVSRLGRVLAELWKQLAERGFCSPSEKSDDQEASSNKVEGGTGLGDGEGAEDISKDVGDDEDLSELAQQAQKQDHEEEIEDEKDAVDMADEELEGSLQDADNGSQEEASDDGHDEQAAMDEELGSVKDDDADALDEKMWDDGNKEEGQAKEDAKSHGTKSDEVAAAQKAEDTASSDGEDDDRQSQADAVESEDATSVDDDTVEQPGQEKLDSRAQEEEVLDLPDDINIDGDAMEDDLSVSDMEMDDRSHPEGEDDTQSQEAEDDAEATDQPLDAEIEDTQGTMDAADEDTNTQDANNPDELLQAKEEMELDKPVEDQTQGAIAGDPGSATDQPTAEPTSNVPSTEAKDDVDEQEAGMQQDTAGVSGANKASRQQDITDQDSTQSRPEAAAQFKKLGEILEEWHKNHQPIDNSEDKQDDSGDPHDGAEDTAAPTQFEHLKDDQDTADTQAVGAGGMEESTAMPDNMSVDEDDEKATFDPDPTEDDKDDAAINHDREHQQKEPGESETLSSNAPKAFVGKERSNMDDDFTMHDHEDQDNLEEMDTQLVRTHISQDEGTLTAIEEARMLWMEHENNTRHLSLVLTEHLRLILQPTQATRMRGDFRTGKRLNIKKIIPYIASSYRRDKIWMRRSVPSKRNYQIMLAIDDSKSMAEGDNKALAFDTLAMVTRALSMLEVGELCVVNFGETVTVAHDFATPFAGDAGAEIFRRFTFDQASTNVRKLLAESIDLFNAARLRATGSSSELWQLQIIISDGVCEDHPGIRQLVRQAQEQRIMIVFIVVDTVIGHESAGTSTEDKKQSILDLQKAEFTKDAAGEMQLQMVKYLDTFPFGYYLLVSDVKELPAVLAGALRQWFAEVVETGSR